jgi:peptidoglycan hydrolase-like protein with peptidoglycan-binding domain
VKKIIIFLILLFIPVLASATIDQNLYYGLKQSNEVKELQQYLIDRGFLVSNVTGNFYSLTLAAVEKYQASKNIHATGYVGPLTRQAINADLSSNSTNNKTPTTATTNQTLLTGSLDLSQNTSYPNQLITAPQSKFKLSDFSLKNNTTETINLNKIEVDLAIDSNLYTANLYVTNLYVIYGSNQTTILNTVTHNNYWLINFQLPIGQTVDLSVYGDINSSIPLNSTIKSGILVTGTSAVSGTNAYTNSNAVLSGQNIAFGTGSLTVAEDGSTPLSKLVAVNHRVEAGRFQFTSVSDAYAISELKFVVPISSIASTVSDAILVDTATQALLVPKPISVTYDGNYYSLDFNVNIPVSLNSSKSVTLYYDLSSSIDSYNTNINIAPILTYIKATNSRGVLMDGAAPSYNNTASYGGITLPPAGITVNGLYVFKSIPTFTAASASVVAPNNSNVNLYTLSIAADPNGDISLKQLTFIVTIADPNLVNPHLTNFTLFKGNTDYTGSVTIGNIINNNYYVGLTSMGGVGIGMINTVVVAFNSEETIPAGKTQTYTLKAYTNNFISSSSLGSDSISTFVPSDTNMVNGGSHLGTMFTNVYYGLLQKPTNVSVVNYNLLWSDKSTSFPNPHNNLNGYYTDDWYNGFDVLNLPLAAQTITAK